LEVDGFSVSIKKNLVSSETKILISGVLTRENRESFIEEITKTVTESSRKNITLNFINFVLNDWEFLLDLILIQKKKITGVLMDFQKTEVLIIENILIKPIVPIINFYKVDKKIHREIMNKYYLFLHSQSEFTSIENNKSHFLTYKQKNGKSILVNFFFI